MSMKNWLFSVVVSLQKLLAHSNAEKEIGIIRIEHF